MTAASLSTTQVTCSALDTVEPQALGVTYTFTAADSSTATPYPLTVAFTGRRKVTQHEPGAVDTFEVIETVTDVLPSSGRVSLSTRIENIPAGTWEVTARPQERAGTDDPPAEFLPVAATTTGHTGFAPLIKVRAPGVRLGAWPGLVTTGAGAALALQSLFVGRMGLPALPVLALSLIACLLGVLGARVYYMIEHPVRRRGWMNMSSGMCIQGFVLVAVAVLLGGALLLKLPIGSLLDATAPGLLLGMAIGRLGCFFGGCCAGRPTASRWGRWSSDRKLGRLRLPTQLYESAMALLLGATASVVLVVTDRATGGAVFVAALAAYVAGRQLLFPLRDLPRHTTHGRHIVLIVSIIIVLGAILAGILSGGAIR
ncbi:hypothetical protein PSD17_19980 [Pseudonocardia sp. D17]|nr:hypothetical protein PSD17_19980 [Pseudonocardia sp. D17]